MSRRDLERRILDVLRGTEARSSALSHTPTCRELFCRRIVGPVMVRIGFEPNDALEDDDDPDLLPGELADAANVLGV